MARRQNLLFRLLGMVAWAVTLVVLLSRAGIAERSRRRFHMPVSTGGQSRARKIVVDRAGTLSQTGC
jgi:hypothetical protein